MPIIVHSQTTRFPGYNGYPPWPRPYQASYAVPDPVIKSSRVQKTKVDSDGWRPMTAWSKATEYSGVPFGSILLYGTGEAILQDVKEKRYFQVKSLNTPPRVVSIKGLPDWPSTANVKNAALSKLKGQSLNLVMLLKDRRETVKGLTNRLEVLVKSVGYARKGQLVKSARSLRKWWRSRTPGVVNRYRAANDKIGKPLASMWLELNFLHMQVISDANGALEELGRELSVGFVHGRSGLLNESEHTVRHTGYSWSYYPTLVADVKCSRIVYAQISALPDLGWLTSASRLGITNIPYVLWDSVPLSFVADWVLPVGSYLNGFDATLGMKFKGMHIGLIEKTTITRAYCEAPNGYSLSGEMQVTAIAPQSFKRVLTDQFPDLPQPRNPLSGLAWKAATTASLLAGAVKSSQQKPR